MSKLTEQERKNYQSLTNHAATYFGKVVKEYRAIEGDYRVIIEYEGMQERYTITGEVWRRM